MLILTFCVVWLIDEKFLHPVFQSNLAMLPSLKVEVLRVLRILLGKFIAAASVPTTHEGINETNLNDPIGG